MQNRTRAYELYIGENVELLELLEDANASSVSSIPTTDIRTIPSKSNRTVFTDLDMSADIYIDRESRGDCPNVHRVTVTNPSPEGTRFLKVGNTVILNAGYAEQDSLPLILAGSIVRVDIKKKPDGSRVINMLVGEGVQQREKVIYNTTISSKATYEEALNDLIGKFVAYGIPVGRVQLSDDFKQRQLGLSYPVYGSLDTSLQKLLQANGHRWYISGGQLYVEPISKTIETYQNTIDIVPSQIQNTVELLDSSINKTLLEQEVRTSGVTLEVDLDGNLNDVDSVKLVKEDSPSFTESYRNLMGTYKVTSISHSLNFRGSDWCSLITAKD